MGVAKVTFSCAVMPPPVTVKEPPVNWYAVPALSVTACALVEAATVIVPLPAVKAAASSPLRHFPPLTLVAQPDVLLFHVPLPPFQVVLASGPLK